MTNDERYVINLRHAMEQAHKEVMESPEWLRVIYLRNARVDARLRGLPEVPASQYGLPEGTR